MTKTLKTALAAVGLIALLSCAAMAKVDSIAVDDEPGLKAADIGYGIGEGDTPAEAKREAFKQCHAKGCEIAVTYEKCGAYASSRQHSGTGTGNTEEAAKRAALIDCGNDACRVAVSDCVGK
jgi:Domain of unknown function (DUF4189)